MVDKGSPAHSGMRTQMHALTHASTNPLNLSGVVGIQPFQTVHFCSSIGRENLGAGLSRHRLGK